MAGSSPAALRLACAALLAGAWAAPAPAPAQAAAGWLGVGLEPVFLEDRGAGCTTRVRVQAVVAGAPAERAGLRPEDEILAIDGRPVSLGELQRLPAILVRGDTLRLRVRRESGERDVTAVVGARPEGPLAMPRSAPSLAVNRPAVRLEDGRLVLSDLALAGAIMGAGAPLRGADARALRLDGEGGDRELVRRVNALLGCVQRLRAEAMSDGMVRIRIRADSLRQVIARQVLEGLPRLPPGIEGSLNLRIEREPLERAREARRPLEAPPAPFAVEAPIVVTGVPTQLRHVGQHAVSGAEFVELDRELAGYFDGARRGLLVVRVGEGTPAERAGLRPGDVVTAAGGEAVATVAALRAAVHRARETLRLDVVRRGDRHSVRLPRD